MGVRFSFVPDIYFEYPVNGSVLVIIMAGGVGRDLGSLSFHFWILTIACTDLFIDNKKTLLIRLINEILSAIFSAILWSLSYSYFRRLSF